MHMCVFVLVALLGFVLSSPQGQYTTKYDNVDVNDIIKNERLMKRYFDCLMDRGGCSSDGRELKNGISDALESECSKCSERQKDGSRIIIHHLIKNKRDWWNELEQKYDPQMQYVKRYENELKAEGIVL